MKDKWDLYFVRIWYQLNYFVIYAVMKLIDLLIFMKSVRRKFRKDLINQVVMKLEYITVLILTSAKILTS